MARSAKKCEKNQSINKEKLKKVRNAARPPLRPCQRRQSDRYCCIHQAIEQGNMEGAKIYAQVRCTSDIFLLHVADVVCCFYSSQNVIREKNQALNFLRLGSRIDAVASRLETAIRKICLYVW